MLSISEKLSGQRAADARLVLPFELRSRSRFRAALADGEEVGVVLTRGQILRGGDLLRASDGRVIEVSAAAETVSTAHCADPQLLARAAYHLGNRHVPLQLGSGWLRYLHDHVLDHMLEGLGIRVIVEQAPFEPEAGAYHGHTDGDTGGAAGAAAHGHSHAAHSHGHSHE